MIERSPTFLMSLTTELILKEYTSVDDALDDYLDAKNDGKTSATFESWFVRQFEKEECIAILDHPDLPQVVFDEDDDQDEGTAGRRAPKPIPPNPDTPGYMEEPPSGEDKLIHA